MYSFIDEYSEYHQVNIAHENILKTINTSFCYEVLSFGFCNALAIFQRKINKVLKSYLRHFVRVFMDDFGVYGDQTPYLEKLEKNFERLDEL